MVRRAWGYNVGDFCGLRNGVTDPLLSGLSGVPQCLGRPPPPQGVIWTMLEFGTKWLTYRNSKFYYSRLPQLVWCEWLSNCWMLPQCWIHLFGIKKKILASIFWLCPASGSLISSLFCFLVMVNCYFVVLLWWTFLFCNSKSLSNFHFVTFFFHCAASWTESLFSLVSSMPYD